MDRGAKQRAAQAALAQSRKEMRELRVERQRQRELYTYAQAFEAIDADGSGRVDPAEIVAFVEGRGQSVHTRTFWKIFSELDLDRSEDLDMAEFTSLMDAVTASTKMAKVTARDREREEEDPDRPRRPAPSTNGSLFMDSLVEQKRQVVDIYSALGEISENFDKVAHLMGLADDSPPEADLHQTHLLGSTSFSVMSQESLASLASTADFTHDAAMDKFVEIFTARPVTAPRHSEEPGDPPHCAWGVERRGEFSPLGPPAGGFLALGFGLRLVGTASSRR